MKWLPGRQDLAVTMGIDAAPEFVRVFRHPQAIPQYTVSHGTAGAGRVAKSTSGADPDRNSYRASD